MISKKERVRGFTLVELLVVMAIIGILAAVILGGFRSSQRRARDAKRKSDLRQIGQALEMFYSDYQMFPLSSNGNIMACDYDPVAGSGECSWGSGPMQDTTGRLYFRQLPDDPSDGFTYYYRTLLSNQAFQLYTHLENEDDQNCTNEGCTNDGFPVTGDECGEICNFSVTSTNVTPKD